MNLLKKGGFIKNSDIFKKDLSKYHKENPLAKYHKEKADWKIECNRGFNSSIEEHDIKKMESAKIQDRNNIIKAINKTAYVIDSIERDVATHLRYDNEKRYFRPCKTPQGISYEQILKKKKELNRLVSRLNRKWKTKYDIPFPEIKLESSLNRCTRKNRQYRGCTKTVTELRKEINSKKIELTDINNKLKDVVKKSNKVNLLLFNSENSNHRLKLTNSTLDKTIKKLTTDIKSLENDNASSVTKINELETKYSNLEKSKAKCDSSLSTLGSDKKKLSSELSRLKVIKSGLDKTIYGLKSAKSECESDLDEKIRLYDDMVENDQTNILLFLLVVLIIVVVVMYLRSPGKKEPVKLSIPNEVDK